MSVAKVAMLCAVALALPHVVLARADVAAPKLIILEGRALTPLRHVSEWLGAEVSFDSSSKAVGVRMGEQEIALRVGSSEARVNGASVTLDVPVVERSGAIYVPLRFLADSMHAVVMWDASEKTVTIRHPSRNAILRLTATGSTESLLAPTVAPMPSTAEPAPPTPAPVGEGYDVLKITAEASPEILASANRQGCPMSAVSALFGVQLSRAHGCVIGAVTPGGLAEKAGLKAGDSIVGCNGGEATCPRTLVPLLSASKEPGKVELIVHRPKAG